MTEKALATLLWATENFLKFENSRERPDDSDYSRWLYHTEMMDDACHGARIALHIEPYEASND